MAKADPNSTTFNLSRRGLVIGAAVLPAITIPAVAELQKPPLGGAVRRELSVSSRTTPSRLRSGRRKNPRLGEKQEESRSCQSERNTNSTRRGHVCFRRLSDQRRGRNSALMGRAGASLRRRSATGQTWSKKYATIEQCLTGFFIGPPNFQPRSLCGAFSLARLSSPVPYAILVEFAFPIRPITILSFDVSKSN